MKAAKMTPSWNLLRPSVELVVKMPEQVIVLVLLPSLLTVLGSVLALHDTSAGLGVRALGGLWILVNVAATYYLQLAGARGQTPSLAECYRDSWHYYWRILGFTILFSVMLLVGLVLLIVPGLIVLRRYFLAFFYILDDDLSIRDAMKKCSSQTKPFAANVWGVLGVVVAVAFLSAAIASLIFATVPSVGAVVAAIFSLSYLFLPAMRYLEIKKASR